MQNVISRKCDIYGCDERSTSYSSGHGRWCDKHSPLPNFSPDLKGRRAELRDKVVDILTRYPRVTLPGRTFVAEKILSELKL